MAASYLEPEEYGPPTFVRIEPCPLPLLYQTVTVTEERERIFQLESQMFSANGVDDLRMTFALAGDARLEWTRRDGWQLTEQSQTRALAPGTRLIFDPRP